MLKYVETDPNNQTATSEEILDGMRKVAKMVELYGDAYLPYFVFLEKELEIAKEREALMKRVKAAAEWHRQSNAGSPPRTKAPAKLVPSLPPGLAEFIQKELRKNKLEKEERALGVQQGNPQPAPVGSIESSNDRRGRLGSRMGTLLAHYAQEPPPTFGAMQVGPHTITLAIDHGLLDKTGGGDGWKGQYRTTGKGRIAIEHDRILREEPKFKRAFLIAELDARSKPAG